MAQKIALVACVGQKALTSQPAHLLYTSAWFQKAAAYAQQIADRWFILSAQYGLVAPEQVIAPYEQTLNRMAASRRRAWAERVLAGLQQEVRPGDEIVILAGQRYREYLVAPLQALGCEVRVPMAGLRIGEQLRWLNEHQE